jgi:predicted nucleic acid-binding protein
LSRYLDTSVLVCALTHEAATPRVQAWLARQAAGDLMISDWVVTEVSSALSIKLRTGAITQPQRADALAGFRRLTDRSLSCAPVERAHFSDAARLADQFALGLRAADALHLAVARTHGAILCTLDRRLADAAGAVGAKAELI